MLTLPLALSLLAGRAAAAALTGVSFSQDDKGLVQIHYRLDGQGSESFKVGFKVSDDGGQTFDIIPTAVTGDVGQVSASGDKAAAWDVEKDHPDLFCEDCAIAVEARPALSAGRELDREMSLIPAGPFQMGSPDNEGSANEHPRHKIFLESFLIDRYPVTVAQFRAFAQATGRSMPIQPAWNKDDHPVVSVNWNEADAYCAWTGKRLPTEAEWEKAARGRSDARYSFGDSEVQLSTYAWFSNNSEGQTHPVGQKKPNRYGLYDMQGNAAQWVSDWYGESYAGAEPKDPQGPTSGAMRVLRGGSWSSFAAACRAASRDWFFPEGRAETNSLRCASSAGRP
jgi:formylglycine-generating enzyme required for sulfatase activity